MSLRAVDAAPALARRFLPLVGASMGPRQRVELALDVQRSCLQVDVVPGEPERFTLAEPEHQRNEPPGPVIAAGGSSDEPRGLGSDQDLRLRPEASGQPRPPRDGGARPSQRRSLAACSYPSGLHASKGHILLARVERYSCWW